MSEQRVQQPMVRGVERRAPPEVRVVRRRRLPTPGAAPSRHSPARPRLHAPQPPLSAPGPGSRAAFVSFPGGRSVRRAQPERLAGVPEARGAGLLLGEGESGRRGGRTRREEELQVR